MDAKFIGWVKIVGTSDQWKLEPKTPPFAEICLLTRGGFSVVSAQNLQIFACGAIKIALENEYREH